MAELSPSCLAEITETCRAGAAEAVGALKRGIDLDATLLVDSSADVDLQALPPGFEGPGLVVVLTVGKAGALVVLPASSGLVPDWCANPDPTGQSRLSTLAQELGIILLPEQYAPADFKAGMVKSIAGALARGGVGAGAVMVPLKIQSPGGADASISLIWPATRPGAVLGASAASGAKPKVDTASQAKPAKARPGAARTVAASISRSRNAPPSVEHLPTYSRSLLRIKVPVVVTLARKRQRLSRILELGPGSIIQFEKSCEEMLELEVGGRTIATGEAVKVGEKFGLRINAIVLPEERFRAIKPPGSAGDEPERRESGEKSVVLHG